MDGRSLEQARQYALQRLERELSPNLFYHGIAHTRDIVVPAATLLAEKEKLNEEEFHLLLTAAWFHDLGFIKQPAYHELISTKIAAEALPTFGYTDDQVETICWIIFATVLPQSPVTLPQKIMADADLMVLGSDEFMVHNRNLRRELSFFGKEYTDAEWLKVQLKFLESHTYFTISARALMGCGSIKKYRRP
ncbi:HD domain-containing protein [Candidatus Villigracilis saccharophilus]|uniref:HD domain-containing protein n=1 Tax=Candidatus Villigracilis saccharophilus TaxID=3140684 RepID=UPI0031374469|nr:HD domain-containing protein [Anaerolineales bacterium]